MICFIDHFDSFSFNVLDWIASGNNATEVIRVRADDVDTLGRLRQGMCPVVFSPGPGCPSSATESLELCRSLIGRVPILGICLGHQLLGAAFGWQVVRSKNPFHGSRRQVRVVDRSSLLADVTDFSVATYNSLVIAPPSSSLGICTFRDDELRITALCDQGEVQAIETSGRVKAAGVQFHPESFLSDDLSAFRDRWLAHAREWTAAQSSATAPLLMPS